MFGITKLCTVAEKGIMLLSAGEPSDTIAEINQAIVAGKQTAGNVFIIAFGIGSGTLYVIVCSDCIVSALT